MEEKQLKYYKMHHDLQEQIRLGELRSGDRVPSENQLAAAYQVSRQTVRKALADSGTGGIHLCGTRERHLCVGAGPPGA